MIRLIKYALLIVVLIALYHVINVAFLETSNKSNNELNTSNNIIKQTEKIVRNTYQGGMENLKENMDLAVRNSENLLKQIILE